MNVNIDNFEGKKGLLLISGGIDSPVAGSVMLKRGMEIGAIHFLNSGEIDDKVVDLIKLIGIKNFYSVKFAGIQKSFMDNCDKRYQCIFCKRSMVRIAEKVAIENGYDYLITGDNLGQVASQTMKNMAVIDNATKLIVLRPLISMDKNDIIDIAKDIGSYEISTKYEYDCPFLPNNPKTTSEIFHIEKEEGKIDVDGLIESFEFY